MLYELRIYTCKPGSVNTVLDMWKNQGQDMISKYMKMTGQWVAESGTVNQIYTIWEFDSYDDRSRARENLLKDEKFISYLKKCRENYISQEVVLLNPTEISPLKG